LDNFDLEFREDKSKEIGKVLGKKEI